MLEAQKEVEESNSGIRGLIRKVFKPSVMLSNAPVSEEKELVMSFKATNFMLINPDPR